MKKTKKPKSVEFEFNFYLKVIKETMDPDGSFLELGPKDFSLSNHFKDVTMVDKDIEVIKKYASKGRKIIHGDYHSLIIPPDSFDYVIALHPDICRSGENIKWVDLEERRFKFRGRNLERFVSSLLDIAKEKVFIASKEISDNTPMKKYVSKVVIRPPQFVLYNKSIQLDPSGWLKKWKK